MENLTVKALHSNDRDVVSLTCRSFPTFHQKRIHHLPASFHTNMFCQIKLVWTPKKRRPSLQNNSFNEFHDSQGALPHLPTSSTKFARFFRSFFHKPKVSCLPNSSDVSVNWVNRNETIIEPWKIWGMDTEMIQKNMYTNCIKFQVRRSFSPIIFA